MAVTIKSSRNGDYIMSDDLKKENDIEKEVPKMEEETPKIEKETPKPDKSVPKDENEAPVQEKKTPRADKKASGTDKKDYVAEKKNSGTDKKAPDTDNSKKNAGKSAVKSGDKDPKKSKTGTDVLKKPSEETKKKIVKPVENIDKPVKKNPDSEVLKSTEKGTAKPASKETKKIVGKNDTKPAVKKNGKDTSVLTDKDKPKKKGDTGVLEGKKKGDTGVLSGKKSGNTGVLDTGKNTNVLTDEEPEDDYASQIDEEYETGTLKAADDDQEAAKDAKATKKKKKKTKSRIAIGIFLSMFLRAVVVILGILIALLSVNFVYQLELHRRAKAEKVNPDPAVFTQKEMDELLTATPTEASTAAPFEQYAETIDYHIGIDVINATGTSGLAGHWRNKLMDLGYTDVFAADSYSQYETTRIVVTEEGLVPELASFFPGIEYEVGNVGTDEMNGPTEGIKVYIFLGNSSDELSTEE